CEAGGRSGGARVPADPGRGSPRSSGGREARDRVEARCGCRRGKPSSLNRTRVAVLPGGEAMSVPWPRRSRVRGGSKDANRWARPGSRDRVEAAEFGYLGAMFCTVGPFVDLSRAVGDRRKQQRISGTGSVTAGTG